MKKELVFPESTPQHPRFSISPVTVIVACAIALAILGITILFSASASFKQGPTYYLTKQLFGIGAACVLGFIISRLDLEAVRRHAWWLGLLALFLLVAVLIPHIGIMVNGSRRWLGFGPVRLQVSEIGKFALVFVLAHYLAINQTRIGEFKRGFLYPLGIIALAALPIAKEPDLGTAALVIAVGLLLLFLAGAKWRYMLSAGAVVAALFAFAIWQMPNRLTRFMAYLDVEANKTDGTYQLYQSLAAFAVGGVEGAGLGNGRQQMSFLPEAHTDFIFAIAGEELGLYCTMGVVVLFAAIFIAGIVHLRRAPNMFQFLLATGAIMLISLQAIINLGVVTGLLPTKGMSLPFISAGISNMLLMGALIGVLVNTQRYWPRPSLSRNERLMKEVVDT